jgi:hypothetical protein
VRVNNVCVTLVDKSQIDPSGLTTYSSYGEIIKLPIVHKKLLTIEDNELGVQRKKMYS